MRIETYEPSPLAAEGGPDLAAALSARERIELLLGRELTRMLLAALAHDHERRGSSSP
jgi:hypothetical protein